MALHGWITKVKGERPKVLLLSKNHDLVNQNNNIIKIPTIN